MKVEIPLSVLKQVVDVSADFVFKNHRYTHYLNGIGVIPDKDSDDPMAMYLAELQSSSSALMTLMSTLEVNGIMAKLDDAYEPPYTELTKDMAESFDRPEEEYDFILMDLSGAEDSLTEAMPKSSAVDPEDASLGDDMDSFIQAHGKIAVIQASSYMRSKKYPISRMVSVIENRLGGLGLSMDKVGVVSLPSKLYSGMKKKISLPEVGVADLMSGAKDLELAKIFNHEIDEALTNAASVVNVIVGNFNKK